MQSPDNRNTFTSDNVTKTVMMPDKPNTNKVLLAIAALVVAAAGIQSASAATLPLPVETFISGGTIIHVEVASASGVGTHPTVLLLYGENGEVGPFSVELSVHRSAICVARIQLFYSALSRQITTVALG